MKGLIFSIKRYSVHDGPGIRVTFFLKGCPLSCWWCHNPEGISPLPEKVEQIEKVGEVEFIKTETAGEFYSVGEIIEILEKDKIFILQSNGGVTFSGGEPLFQSGFLLEALKQCKENGYHTAIDTSGYFNPEILETIIPFTDLFLFDIKHLDERKHILYTGVSNELILSNFQMILQSGKDTILRIPIIPGLNDDPGNLEKVKAFLVGLKCKNLKKISLLPYHKIGITKYKKFNIPTKMGSIKPPSSERMYNLKAFLEETGIKVKIGG